jgi:hypothetical protein
MPAHSTFTQEVADEICWRIANGESLVDICGPDRDRRLPHRQTVYVWLAERDGFHRAYRRARDIQADLFIDQIVKIADATDGDSRGPRDVRRDSLRVNVRRWIASRLAPKRYGDRVVLAGEDDGQPTEASQENAAARIVALLEAVRRRKEGDET